MTTTRRSFDPIAVSAHGARSLVHEAVGHRPDIDVEVAVLLTSELATNAIIHSGTPFAVEVVSEDAVVRVSVEDGNCDRPATRRDAEDGDTTGRGLAIVAAIADEWGAEQSAAGKRVWFELRASPPGT